MHKVHTFDFITLKSREKLRKKYKLFDSYRQNWPLQCQRSGKGARYLVVVVVCGFWDLLLQYRHRSRRSSRKGSALLVLEFLNPRSSADLRPPSFLFSASSFRFAQSEWVEYSGGHLGRTVAAPGSGPRCDLMLSVASTSFALMGKECMSGSETRLKCPLSTFRLFYSFSFFHFVQMWIRSQFIGAWLGKRVLFPPLPTGRAQVWTPAPNRLRDNSRTNVTPSNSCESVHFAKFKFQCRLFLFCQLKPQCWILPTSAFLFFSQNRSVWERLG